jgi:hypothetical protein
MRRIIRRTDTIITVQTRTVTWTEDVPPADPAPATLASPWPDASTPAAAPEPPAPGPTPPGDAS